jgi:hypothetical protein
MVYDTTTRTPNIYDGQQWKSLLVTAYAEKTLNYTVSPSDVTVVLLSGSYTFTLPYASTVRGQIFYLKNNGTGILTISAAELIDGSYTQTLTNQYETLQLQSGTNKWVIL